ncbi:zinc finger BED domain-containing protein 6-like [Hydra vulgaris]|uniref:Zinc finger BED domain-containing protein 6-like n=1 Tax=Hydra vulgaris TaxID=6087 RepID=A0ABM4BMI2_HYDVU
MATSSRRKNPLWNYFKVSDAICIICKKILCRGSKDAHNMSTTNLQNHLKNMHYNIHSMMLSQTKTVNHESSPDPNQKYVKQFCTTQTICSNKTSSVESVQIIASTATYETQGCSHVSNNSIPSFQRASKQVSLREILQRKELWQLDNSKAQVITKLIGEMICLDLQPYCIVEDKGFTRILTNLAPKYTIPSRKHFSTKVIPLMYETIKAKVKYELDQADFLSLTCDALQTWEIPHEKIHAVLTDNAANVMAAIKESNLGDKHLPCLIHTLQLCIQKKIFREQETTSDAIAVFRALAGHFHHSSSAVSKLKEIQSQLKLPEHKIFQDVSTRWSSTYYMLERFIEQKKTIALYCITRTQTNAKNPTENQWQLAEMLVCILKHFESATKEMSKETACTSEIIPFIYEIEKFLDYACDTPTEIKTVVYELKKDFNCRFQKYKDNVDLKVAMMLDPRSKFYQFCSESHLQLAKEIDFSVARGSGSDSEGSLNSFSESKLHESDSDFADHGSPLKTNKLMSMDIYNFLLHSVQMSMPYKIQKVLTDREKEKEAIVQWEKTQTVKVKW